MQTHPAPPSRRLKDRLRQAIDSGALRELLLFLVVGGTSAVLYIAINVALTTLAGMRPSLAILLTLAMLVPPTYLAQRRLTFQSDRSHAAAFPRYLGTQLAGNGLAFIVAEIFSATIRRHPTVSFIVIAVLVAAANYAVLKFWAFPSSAEPKPAAQPKSC